MRVAHVICNSYNNLSLMYSGGQAQPAFRPHCPWEAALELQYSRPYILVFLLLNTQLGPLTGIIFPYL